MARPCGGAGAVCFDEHAREEAKEEPARVALGRLEGLVCSKTKAALTA